MEFVKAEFVYPSSQPLRPYIEFFSFLRTPGETEVDLLLFPNVVTIMSLSPHTEIGVDRSVVTVDFRPERIGIQSDITGRFLSPLLFRYRGECSEICVVFKPLGLEYFFGRTFSEIAPNNYQSFQPDHVDWNDFTQDLFRIDDQPEQVAFMESYLLSKLTDARLDKLRSAVDCLTDVETNMPIREIAGSVGLDQKNLQRQFNRHVGCSPATFRRIVRFRHSIGLQLTESNTLDLTATSHESNFFDQSHFTREFRRLSAMSPKEFFQATWKLPPYGIVWKLG